MLLRNFGKFWEFLGNVVIKEFFTGLKITFENNLSSWFKSLSELELTLAQVSVFMYILTAPSFSHVGLILLFEVASSVYSLIWGTKHYCIRITIRASVMELINAELR